MLEVSFIKKEKVAKDIYSFWFEPSTQLRFIAGQFIELYLPHNDPDSRGTKRWFTISSAPQDKLLSITTKVTEKSSTYKQTLYGLKSGAKLKMANPMGDFVLPKDVSIPLLFVAGGIGCTPFHSILKHLNSTNEKRDIKMVYGTNTFDDVAFTDTFNTLGGNFEVVLTNPTANWRGRSGRITTKDILNASEGKRRIYISGPESVVEVLDKELKNAGVPDEQILGDFFPGYQSV